MNLDETPAEIAARSQMATALQQLGHALVGHRVDIDLAHEVAAIARDLTATVTARPTRDRTRELAANPRFAGILSGQPTEPIGVDGQPMDLFRDSIVSGRTNPMGIGLEVRRDGDAAVATTTLGPAFEGAPGRSHGGIVASILDETMGFVLPIIGELAYTANLNIDYVGPESTLHNATIRSVHDGSCGGSSTGDVTIVRAGDYPGASAVCAAISPTYSQAISLRTMISPASANAPADAWLCYPV